MSAERFELSTNGLKGRCSAVELRAHYCYVPRRGKADCILTWEIGIVNVKNMFNHKQCKGICEDLAFPAGIMVNNFPT